MDRQRHETDRSSFRIMGRAYVEWILKGIAGRTVESWIDKGIRERPEFN